MDINTIMTNQILFFLLIGSAILGLVISWRIFEKAGEPGIYSLIPIFNIYIYFRILGMPIYYILIAFIPVVGSLLLSVMIALYLGKAFGKSDAFKVGLILLSPIFMVILAFDDSQYEGA